MRQLHTLFINPNMRIPDDFNAGAAATIPMRNIGNGKISVSPHYENAFKRAYPDVGYRYDVSGNLIINERDLSNYNA